MFREWSQKWPEATKERLKEKLRELDSGIMGKIEDELKLLENGNGHLDVVEVQIEEEEVAQQIPINNEPESLVINSLPDEIVTA